MSKHSVMDLLSERESQLLIQRRELDDELSKVRAAKSAIESQSKTLARRTISRSDSGAKSALPTIKDMAMLVLYESESALTADEILNKINETFSTTLARTSLSPQLSRLRSEKRLRYDPNTKSWGTEHHLPQIEVEPNSVET